MGNTQYAVSIKLIPDDEVTKHVKGLLDSVKQSQGNANSVADSVKKTKKAAVDYTTRFSDSFQHLGRSIQGVRSELNFLRGTYQTITSVAGIGLRDVVSTALDWNVSLESVGLSVATVLSSVDTATKGPFSDFNIAQEKTNDLFKLMREEAKATPSEFENIADTFQTLLPLTRSLMPDLESIVKLSANVASWDIMGGNAKGVTARDVRQILGGQVAITQIQNPMLKNRLNELGDLMKEARQLEKDGGAGAGLANQQKALRIMTELLTIPPKARQAWEDSFQGLMNNVKGTLKVLFSEGSNGVFSDLKVWLTSLTVDIEKNPGKYRDAAREFAEIIKKAATFFYSVFEWIFNNFKLIKTVFAGFIGVWTIINGMKFVGALTAFASAWKSGTMLNFIQALAGFNKNPLLAAAGGAAASAAAGTGAGAAGSSLGALALRALIGGALAAGGIGALLANPDTGGGGPKTAHSELRELMASRVEGFEALLGLRNTGMSEFARSSNYLSDDGRRGPLQDTVTDYTQQLYAQVRSKFPNMDVNAPYQLADSFGATFRASRIAQSATTDRKDQMAMEATINLNISGADVQVVSSTGTEGLNVNVKKGQRTVATEGDW